MGDRGRTSEALRSSLRSSWRALTTWPFLVGVFGTAAALAAGIQALRGNGSDEVWFSLWAVLAALVAWLALRRSAPLVDERSFAWGGATAVLAVLSETEPIWLSVGATVIALFAASAAYRVWSRSALSL